jgi:hypothetical protein
MKRYLLLIFTLLFIAVVPLLAQSGDHAEVGVFADYTRLRQSPNENLVGLGGRAAFALRPSIQLEAEMAYDFKRSFTSTFTNGASTELVNTQFRTLHALFGPKFQTGSGPLRLYVTGKTGFVNFSVSNQGATAGFTSALGGVATGGNQVCGLSRRRS